MKIIFTTLFVVLFISKEILSQVVNGKLVDENGAGLAEVYLQLYTSTNVYDATSGINGTFSFNIITGIEDNQLPTGYLVSDNFPNPFNPKTRIGITLPSRENVKVEVFNLLGQSVTDAIEETFDAGANYIDIELNGLPNGFYISRITIDNKYTVVKKLMLIYGSHHLITSGSTITTQLNKPNNTYLDTNLDSLVATSTIIGRKTFIGLPNFVSGTLDLGNFTIERYCPGMPTVVYEGKTYHTVQIGDQCWLKENLDVGTRIDGYLNQTNNVPINFIEKYCYGNTPAKCDTYGGLYQWNEAMQYVTTEGAKGICPTGWHLPTIAELYDTLRAVVNNDGNSLKAIGQGTGSGVGTNTSGFSALLAGNRDYGGFYNLGFNSVFWSSTEFSATLANFMDLYTSYSNIAMHYDTKEYGFSVRCIKDAETPPPSPTLISPNSGAINVSLPPTLTWHESIGSESYTLQVSENSNFSSYAYNQNVGNVLSQQVSGLSNSTMYYWRVSSTNNYGTSAWSSVWSFTTISIGGIHCPGTPTVTYSGKTYNTVQIGRQCWLKENLDVGLIITGGDNQTNNGIIEKYCYDNLESNCDTYGGLYQWAETVQYQNGATNTTSPNPPFSGNVQGICPSGWHLPTIAELYDTLTATVNNDGNSLKEIGQGTGGGEGTNTSGFSALLAGDSNTNGYFYDLGYFTFFWSSTEDNAIYAYYLYLLSSSSSIYMINNYKETGFSVRCVKD